MSKSISYGFLLFCVLIYIFAYCKAGSEGQPKRVVHNQQRLISFPRVGRRADNSWDYNTGRSNLVAFPRVGRSDVNTGLGGDLTVRSGEPKKMNPHVWFGPRLGRVQKRDIFLYDLPHDYQHDFLYSTGSQESRQMHYPSRLNHESEEDVEDNDE